MSSRVSPSNDRASPPRRTPTPSDKLTQQTNKSGATDKIKLEPIGRENEEEGEHTGIGRPEPKDNSVVASQSGAGTTTITSTANGTNSATIVFQRTAQTPEETETVEVNGAAQDPAEYSPPRVYYRSFRDQGKFSANNS